jgi:hypothetical protein
MCTWCGKRMCADCSCRRVLDISDKAAVTTMFAVRSAHGVWSRSQMSECIGYRCSNSRLNILSSRPRIRPLVCLIALLGFVAPIAALERLTGDWVPTSRTDAIATSRIVWLYSSFTENGNVSYTDSREYASTDDACKLGCAQDVTCTGYALHESVCTRFTAGSGPSTTISGVFAKSTPTRLRFIYTITRVTPRGGWQVAVHPEGAAVLVPSSSRVQGAYVLLPETPIFDIVLVPTSPLIQVQFVVTPRQDFKRIKVRDDAKILIYVSSALGAGVVFVLITAALLNLYSKHGTSVA